jgi:hypothetical protein
LNRGTALVVSTLTASHAVFSISIPNLCLAILGGIQPDKLTSYLEQAANALANDGMFQRFQILVYPDHRPWEWRDRTPDNQARNSAFAIFETRVICGDSTDPFVIENCSPAHEPTLSLPILRTT